MTIEKLQTLVSHLLWRQSNYTKSLCFLTSGKLARSSQLAIGDRGPMTKEGRSKMDNRGHMATKARPRHPSHPHPQLLEQCGPLSIPPSPSQARMAPSHWLHIPVPLASAPHRRALCSATRCQAVRPKGMRCCAFCCRAAPAPHLVLRHALLVHRCRDHATSQKTLPSVPCLT